MRDAYDVLIVGGGVTGSSAAYFLASQPGFDGSVLVAERDPSYQDAPSARATGGIRQQFSTPENIHIGLFGAAFVKGIDEHLAIDGESTGVKLTEQGYLLLSTPSALELMRENHAVQREHGADIVFKDPRALAREFPWLDSHRLAGGFFGASNEGWTDPYGLLQAFRRKAQSLGVEFVRDEALSVGRVGARVTGVQLAGGRFVNAGVVVNAAGASGARSLAASVGIELPIESRLRCTFVFECREDISSAPLTLLPNGVAFRPEGTFYLANSAPPPERDVETFANDIDHALFDDLIWPTLAQWIPAFETIKVTNSWSCHYDVNLLDENAIIGRCPGFDNLYVAAGFSGHGLQQSPAVGRALYELIAFGEYRSINLDRLGYERVLAGTALHERACW